MEDKLKKALHELLDAALGNLDSGAMENASALRVILDIGQKTDQRPSSYFIDTIYRALGHMTTEQKVAFITEIAKENGAEVHHVNLSSKETH